MKRLQSQKLNLEFLMILQKTIKRLMQMLQLMLFQNLSRELSQLELHFLTVLKRIKSLELLDNNGITKETKEKDLKKLNKLKKRNDELFK